jgi:hypothetical protein
MKHNFQIISLQKEEFSRLFYLDNSDLEKIGAIRMKADSNPGFPCRVTLEDAEVGEEVILLPYQHHKTDSPYQSTGPIYVRKNAQAANLGVNEIPKMLNHRLLSVRGYNKTGIMLEADVTEGTQLREALNNIFSNMEVEYIHIHNAKPGCFNCAVYRVSDKSE